MLQRTVGSVRAGQFVFPGGKVDDADHGEAFEPICDGLDDATASAPYGDRTRWPRLLVAAIRECFEEAGVLLARPVDGTDVVRFDDPEVARRFNVARHAIHDGSLSLVELCADRAAAAARPTASIWSTTGSRRSASSVDSTPASS